jgi:hypothetical protein
MSISQGDHAIGSSAKSWSEAAGDGARHCTHSHERHDTQRDACSRTPRRLAQPGSVHATDRPVARAHTECVGQEGMRGRVAARAPGFGSPGVGYATRRPVA